MAGISFLASKMGYEVSGCDLEESTAYSDNFFKGHSTNHLKGVDLLVVSPAVYFRKIKDPELVEGEKRGIVITWQEFLGKYLQKGKKVICIAGTHGKSTTTAMAGKLLTDAGLDPLVNLGANYKDWNGGARYGKGGYFVTEADEFYDNFLNYHPEIIILNNIEFDHPDYFKSEKQIYDSYKKFIGNLVGEKVLIINNDSPGVKKLLEEIDTIGINIIKYSLDNNADLQLKVMGKHNIANALGVTKLGKYLKIDDETIIKSLESFSGLERRMELISDKDGIKVYDDYAHHPTAIKATLDAIRGSFKDKRIWAVYEAHSYSRTKALLSNYKGVFDSADKVVVGPIFKARDSETFGIDEKSIADISKHKDVICFNDSEKMFSYLNENIESGDIVLVMGAGKSYLWAREIGGLDKLNILIEEDKSLKELTTFKIGGRSKYYAEVKNEKELSEVSKFAKKNNLKIFVLGGGSDVLINDKDFDGIVIKYIGKSINISENKVIAEAGLGWDELVEYTVKCNLQGIECLSGIPGTVGAAPIQNIGAYGAELKDTFVSLTAFDIDKQKVITFENKDCHFGYRESIFKEKSHWQKYIITSITLKLNVGTTPSLNYESLRGRVGKNPTLMDVRKAVLEVRSEKLEDPLKIGNAGSFFKNPIIKPDQKIRMEKGFPGIKIFPFGSGYKVSAAWLVENAGWKGKIHKGAGVSAKHSLIIVNATGSALSKDVMELSGMIIADVKYKFGITLKPEVQFIGFNKKVAILGYGLEGQDAEKYYRDLGDDVSILDKKFDKNYLKNLEDFDIVVRSPGVYRYLPEITKAEKEGVEITSALKIFFDECPGKIIGVTGTKGKGTTSTLIYEILKSVGKDVYLVGNIGKPYLELLPKLTKDSFIVMELSSFQLIDLTKSPQIAVVLNITLDHMDWHKDKEEYIKAKENIVSYQNPSDFAVINSEYDVPRSFSKLTGGKVVLFNRKDIENKYKEKLLLKGEHNLENIAAAVAVSKIIGIPEDKIVHTVQSFKGLEHRLELVGAVGGITFYNDSFATGPQPTIAAIKSFTEPETLILGGSDKGLDYQELINTIRNKENVKNLIMIGDTRVKIIDTFKGSPFKGKIFDLGYSSMQDIVNKAFEVTPKGGVVVLSPASASFDMFENYKDRGNQFKKAVLQINEKET